MANSFKNVANQAEGAVEGIIIKVKELDQVLLAAVQNLKNLNINTPSTPSGQKNNNKQQQQEIQKLKAAITQLKAEITNLSQAQSTLASQTTKTTKSQTQAISAYDSLIRKQKEARDSLRNLSAGQEVANEKYTKASRNLKKLEDAYARNLRTIKQFRGVINSPMSNPAQIENARKAVDSAVRARERNIQAIKKEKAALSSISPTRKSNTNDVKKAQREYKRLTKEVDRTNKSSNNLSKKGLLGLSRGFKNLLGAFGLISGVRLFASLVKNVFELTKTFDALGFALERITGDLESAAESQRFLLDISEKFGVELIATTNRWIKFLAAAKQSGVTLKDTEDIFRTMAKVAGVLGLKTDELTGIYLALEQMLSKGKVTTEELRRQLGERLPGAMGIMAAAVGVTVSKLDEMLKKGEVLSAEVLPKFAKAVELAYSLESVENIQTLVAEQNRLTTSWQKFVKNVADGDSIINKTFMFLLITLKEMVGLMDDLLGGKGVALEKNIQASSDVLKSELDEMAEKELMLEGFALRRKLKEKKDAIELLKIKKDVSLESVLQAEQEYSDIISALQTHNEQKEAIIKSYAKDNVEASKAEFDKATKDYEEFLAKENRLNKTREENFFNFKFSQGNLKSIFGDDEINGIIIDSEEAFNKAFASVENNLANATSKWGLFKKLIEETRVVVPGEDEDEGGGSRAAFKVDEERKALFELMKLEQEANIARYKSIAENEDIIIEVRQGARERQLEEEKKLVDMISEYELQVLEDKLKHEGKTLEDAQNQVLLMEKQSMYEKFELNKKYYADLLNIVKSYNKAELQELKRQQEEEQLIRDEKVIAKKKELEKEGILSQKQINEALVKYKKELYVEDTKNFIEQLIKKKEAELAAFGDNPEMQMEIRKQIASLQTALNDLDFDDVDEKVNKVNNSIRNFLRSFSTEAMSDFGFNTLNEILQMDEKGKTLFENMMDNAENAAEKFGIAFTAITEVAQEAFNFMEQNQQAYFDAQFLNLEKERDIAIQFAGDSATAREEIERQYEDKRRKIQAKQAKAQQEQALFNVIVNTAQGVVAALTSTPPNIPMSIAVGLIGAAQASMIKSQPIPEFWKGTNNAPQGLALVDEKRPEVHTDRKGNIKSLGEQGANYRYLNKGDKIFKSREEYFNKELSSMLNVHDILPYNEVMGMKSPIVNIKNDGIKKEDFVREINNMTNRLLSKETSIVTLDKKGFQTSIKKGNTKRNLDNNILNLKGGVV